MLVVLAVSAGLFIVLLVHDRVYLSSRFGHNKTPTQPGQGQNYKVYSRVKLREYGGVNNFKKIFVFLIFCKF